MRDNFAQATPTAWPVTSEGQARKAGVALVTEPNIDEFAPHAGREECWRGHRHINPNTTRYRAVRTANASSTGRPIQAAGALTPKRRANVGAVS